MKQSTFSAQVANKLLTVLQGYTKGIRFVAVLTVLLTMGIGQVWGAEETATNNCQSAVPGTASDLESGKLIQWMVSSTNTYSNPIRVYANTTITISAKTGVKRITKVEITASSTGSYVTNTTNATWNATGTGTCSVGTKSTSGTLITVPMNGDVTTVTIKPSSQTRWSKVVVTYETAAATTYTVTYNKNGATSGTVPTDDTEYNSGATVTVKLNSGSLAKTGYTFSGWNTKEDGTGTTYTAGTGTFIISTNTILYAKWTANTYTVTWIANGETKRTDIGVAYNTSKTAPTVSPIPCGDVIAGWTDATDGNYVHGTSILYSGATPSIQITDNKTFYAVFADYVNE